jgi:hypothetical protein
VKRILRNYVDPGGYRAAWDGTDETGHPVPSGIYLYRLTAGGNSFMRRALVVR